MQSAFSLFCCSFPCCVSCFVLFKSILLLMCSSLFCVPQGCFIVCVLLFCCSFFFNVGLFILLADFCFVLMFSLSTQNAYYRYTVEQTQNANTPKDILI